MLLASAKKLRSFGIIGMNQRNFGLISRYNPRHLYPLVDDKLKTKLLAQKAGITVPKLLGTVDYQHDVKLLKEILQPHAQFVVSYQDPQEIHNGCLSFSERLCIVREIVTGG